MGMRLTVKAASSDSENSHIPDFTEGKSLKEEWYMQFEVAQSEEEGQVTPQRFLQLRHRETSQYLMSNENGRVSCTPTSSESTWWIMQRVGSNDALAAGENGVSDATKSASPESAEDQYILISRKNPLRRLCCTKGFEGSGQDFMLIASKQPGTQPSIWTLKFTSGELCYVVNPVVHHHMRCNMYGNLSLTSQSNAWEIFRFVEVGNGDVYISSWTHFSKFLSSNSDGKVYTVDHESTSPGYSERWRLESPPKGNGLYIRNVASRRYLSVGKTRNQHLWTTTKLNDYAVWHLDAPQLHIYYLTSLFASTQKETDDDESLKETSIDPNQLYFQDGFDDVHVSSRKEGPCLSKKKEGEEEWKVEVTPEGYFTFFSVLHEKYLGCNSKGDVHTTTSKGAWTLWEKQASPYGGVTFKSKEHGRFLAVTKTNNALHTTEGDKETDLRHSWRIDPRIPRIVTGGTGAFIAGRCNGLKMKQKLNIVPNYLSASIFCVSVALCSCCCYAVTDALIVLVVSVNAAI